MEPLRWDISSAADGLFQAERSGFPFKLKEADFYLLQPTPKFHPANGKTPMTHITAPIRVISARAARIKFLVVSSRTIKARVNDMATPLRARYMRF
jgi:hypothetical protein